MAPIHFGTTFNIYTFFNLISFMEAANFYPGTVTTFGLMSFSFRRGAVMQGPSRTGTNSLMLRWHRYRTHRYSIPLLVSEGTGLGPACALRMGRSRT